MRLNGSLAVLSVLALLAACGRGEPGGPGAGGREWQPPIVSVEAVRPLRFADRIEAVGTAYATESTVLTSTVTERVVRLNFRDGAFVRSGQVIAELARSEEAADLAGAEARAREAQQQLERLRALQSRGFATNARVDAQMAAVHAAQAQANAIRAQIGDRVIRAPFSGVVGLRRISVGATVSAGTEIATVSDLSSIKLDFSVPESALGAIREAQTIEARAAAYPGRPFTGRIAGIDPVVDPQTRSVMIRAVLPNADRQLRPGMLLTVAILANPREVLAVPELAVVAEGARSFVFKVDSEMTALKVPIVPGARQDGMVEVRRGLAAGDQVVAEGVVKVRDGGKVRDHAAALQSPPEPLRQGRTG